MNIQRVSPREILSAYIGADRKRRLNAEASANERSASAELRRILRHHFVECDSIENRPNGAALGT